MMGRDRGRRPRGRIAVGLLIAALTGGTTAGAQGGALRIDLGVSAATPWVRDGNGTRVRDGVGPFMAIDLRWLRRATGNTGDTGATRDTRDTAARMLPTLQLRVGAAPLRGAAEGRSWDAGSTVHADLSLGIEHPVARQTRARLGVAHSWIRGPDDVTPFRRGLGALRAWGLDASVARDSSLPLGLGGVLGLHLLRVGSRGDSATDVDAGWVARLRIGLRLRIDARARTDHLELTIPDGVKQSVRHGR